MNPTEAAPQTYEKPMWVLWRYIYLLGSYFCLATALNFIVSGQQAGTDAWSLLHLGMSLQTSLTFGEAAQLVGLLLVLFTWYLGTKPRLATWLNMWLVGEFFDWIYFASNGFLHPATPWGQWACLLTGYTMLGFAMAWCISANLGAGPRDQLMVTLVRLTGIRVATIRIIMEAAAACIGIILGGPLGLGTLLGVLWVGPAAEKFIGVFRMIGQRTFLSPIIYIPIQEKGGRLPDLTRGEA